jgi:hypothetical protein
MLAGEKHLSIIILLWPYQLSDIFGAIRVSINTLATKEQATTTVVT